jgi:hypothetical protein
MPRPHQLPGRFSRPILEHNNNIREIRKQFVLFVVQAVFPPAWTLTPVQLLPAKRPPAKAKSILPRGIIT